MIRHPSRNKYMILGKIRLQSSLSQRRDTQFEYESPVFYVNQSFLGCDIVVGETSTG